MPRHPARARSTRLLATSALACTVTALALGAGPATAGDTGGGGGFGDQAGGGAGNGTIAVDVSISGSSVGNGGVTRSGGSGGGGTITVSTPPACYWNGMNGAYTGASMYDDLQRVPQRWGVGSEANYLPSQAEVERHKDDDGVWYTVWPGENSNVVQGSSGGISWDDITASCISRLRTGAGPGANGGNAGYIFVPTGTQPPAPLPAPPSPEQLRDAAMDALTLPVPDMTVNPTNRTLVSVPTWFSVPGADFRVWDVTATAAIPGAPVVSATVTATPSAFSVSSRGGASGPCTPARAVNTWSAGEADASACTVDFVRSSLGQPGNAYDVDGTTAYDTAWTSTVGGAAGPGGGLATQTRTGQVDVPVAESQALVRSAG